MMCSKTVICNRSRATGKDIDACLGDYEAQAACPEWATATALEKIERLIRSKPVSTGFTADIDKARRER